MIDAAASPFDQHHFDFSPWFFWRHASEAERIRQVQLQQLMSSQTDAVI